MMKFPLKNTLSSVALFKARCARFGPLDVDGSAGTWAVPCRPGTTLSCLMAPRV
jgi:hypothetical protein